MLSGTNTVNLPIDVQANSIVFDIQGGQLVLNGALSGTYPLAQMTGSDGYVSFEAYGAFAIYDNLDISVVSTPTRSPG